MSRTQKSNRRQPEIRDEYRFDFAKSRPNRFASRFDHDAVAVLLEPDVARIFKTSQAVNRLLRSVISAVPHNDEKTSKRKARS